jgi:hypothetical protein
MRIELDSVQCVTLREVLETRLGNLSSEIRHTDSPRVRQELRDEREVLRSLLELVPAPRTEPTAV